MKSKRSLITVLTLVLFMAGCVAPEEEAAPTTTALPVTLTLAPASPPPPTETPLPPPPPPTPAPVEGTSATQINVRAEPSTVSDILGMLPANTVLQIVGKDPGENWWQILYPQGPDGKGWVTAQYVTTANADQVPVMGGNAIDPNTGNVAIVQQQINVRSGPGTGFNSLGTLNAQDVVSLTGKDANGAWLQIAFAEGPEGKGWVNAAFVQARGVENLPIITEAGQVVGTGTPTSVPATRTPTVIPARQDGDSQENPIASVILEANGTHTMIYSGDLSTPDGDSQDWVGFKPYSRMIAISLMCTNEALLQVTLLEPDTGMNTSITCGTQPKPIEVKPGANYSIHLAANTKTDSLQYIGYTLTIESIP